MSNIKSFCKIILFCAVSVLFAGCPNDPDDDDIFEPSYEDDITSSNSTKEEKNTYGKISLVSRNGVSLKIKFEVSSDVDYFYCGKGTNISEKSKCWEEKTYTYEELKPGKEYTFTLIPYTKDGKRRDPLRATFSTASSPYTNYICVEGEFYKLTSATMDVSYSSSTTGANWKYLRLYVSDKQYVIFNYAVHTWDPIDSDWGVGTYTIENGSYYTYGGSYINGSKSDGFYEGEMIIKYQNGSKVLDFDCVGDWKSYIGHAIMN